MKLIYLIIFTVIFSACSAQKNNRNQEINNLEKPPGVSDVKQSKSQDSVEQTSDSDHETRKGLSADVYTIENHGKELIIKRKLDEAWELLGKAVELNELKITGKNQANISYKVAYKSDGILDGFNLLGNTKASTYLLKLDEKADETTVSISKIEDEDDVDQSALKDGAPDYSYDNSSKLRDLLFTTLQKHVPL